LVSTGRRDSSAGLAFTLSVGSTNAVSWAKVEPSDAMMVQNGTVFSLGEAPTGLKATIENARLKAVIAQKGFSNPRPLNGGTLARVALDANPTAQPSTVSLSAVKFQILTGIGGITNLSPTMVIFGQLSLN